MAFRSEKAAFCLVFVASALAAAEFPAKHVHLRRDEPGVLTVNETGVMFKEKKAKKPHDYRWTWNDIQKLVLSPGKIEIVTYKDLKWQFGRDSEFTFRGEDFTAAYAILRDHLPRRLDAELARPVEQTVAEIPAKRLEGRSGHEGALLIAKDQIVFKSSTPDGSHTWILNEVENISSSDPLEMTIASLGTDYRIQLKQPLPESLYNDLWRKLNVRRTH